MLPGLGRKSLSTWLNRFDSLNSQKQSIQLHIQVKYKNILGNGIVKSLQSFNWVSSNYNLKKGFKMGQIWVTE